MSNLLQFSQRFWKLLPTALLILFLALLFRPLQSQNNNEQPVRPTQASFVIELDALPVAVVYAQQLSAGVVAADVAAITLAQLATVEDQQQALLVQLSALDATVIYRTQRVFNGIAVRIAPDQVKQIENFASVRAVYPLIRKVPHHANSLPVIGAPDLWEGVNNSKLTGEGISVAVIDTGVDYIHSDLGGTGNSALYNLNNKTVITDNMPFPNAKVVGGHDFVGEAYNADPDAGPGLFRPNPEPDPDPMDCYGHGTHVAGTVAGGGVKSDGKAYTGIYGTGLNLATLKVAPGVAPKAQLYALKVFGCAGSSEVTDLAIEWAVDPNGDGDLADKMDVINMSLGSNYGATLDVSTIASNNAAAAGVIVVASAGNSGDVHLITGSPAVADRVISVAATGYDSVTGIDYLASFSSRGPRRGDSVLKPDIAAPGIQIFSAALGNANAGGSSGRFSNGTSMAAPHVAGSMALLRQLYPDWTVQELKALVMNTAQPLIRSGFTISSPTYSPARIGGGRIDLRTAVESQLLAFDAAAPERVSLSFGAAQVVTSTIYTRTLAVVNKGTTAISLTLEYVAQTDLPGADIMLPQTSISLAAQSMVTVPVVMIVDPLALQRSYDATLRNIGLRYWLSEEMGWLELIPESAQLTIRVPLYANPKPVGTLALTQANFDFGKTTLPTFTLTLTGTGLSALDPITGYNSLLSLTELQWSSPNTPPIAPDYPDLAVGSYDNADIRYVGIANNLYATGLISDSLLYFAIASYADWSSPNEVEFSIYVDSDNNGSDDYRIFNSDLLHIFDENSSSDAIAVGLEVLASKKKFVIADLNEMDADAGDAALFGNNVMILPIHPAMIGLMQANSVFSYHIESAVAEMTGIVDRSPRLDYDLRQQAIQPLNGTDSPIQRVDAGFVRSYQFDAVRAQGQSDALVFFHHNGTDKRVALVRLTSEVAKLYLPIVGK